MTPQTVSGTGAGRAEHRIYNAAFLVGPDGTTSGAYRKIHLVPFGGARAIETAAVLRRSARRSGLRLLAGDTASTLPVAGRNASVAICYEVIYPSLIRSFVTAGSELLTTITNDA